MPTDLVVLIAATVLGALIALRVTGASWGPALAAPLIAWAVCALAFFAVESDVSIIVGAVVGIVAGALAARLRLKQAAAMAVGLFVPFLAISVASVA